MEAQNGRGTYSRSRGKWDPDTKLKPRSPPRLQAHCFPPPSKKLLRVTGNCWSQCPQAVPLAWKGVPSVRLEVVDGGWNSGTLSESRVSMVTLQMEGKAQPKQIEALGDNFWPGHFWATKKRGMGLNGNDSCWAWKSPDITGSHGNRTRSCTHKGSRYFSGEQVLSFSQIIRSIPDPQKEKSSCLKLPWDFHPFPRSGPWEWFLRTMTMTMTTTKGSSQQPLSALPSGIFIILFYFFFLYSSNFL